MCARRFGYLLCVFYLLAAALLPAHGQSTSGESSLLSGQPQETTSSSLTLTQPPGSLLQLWTQFSEKYQDFSLSLEQFLDQVEAFGISFEDLPLYLEFLTSSYEESERMRKELVESLKEEEKRAEEEEASRKWWRAGFVAAAVCGAVGWASFIFSRP